MTTVHYISASAKRRLLDQRSEVQFACLHGSFWELTGGFCDIDIGVWVEGSSVLAEAALDYKWQLSPHLERQVRYPIDVRVLNHTPIGFRYAASGGLLLYAKDKVLWYNFREETWNQYLDFAPVSTQMLFDLLDASPHPLPPE